jgi:hypothetical protein
MLPKKHLSGARKRKKRKQEDQFIELQKGSIHKFFQLQVMLQVARIIVLSFHSLASGFYNYMIHQYITTLHMLSAVHILDDSSYAKLFIF